MVSEEVVLEPSAQVARLDREAEHCGVGQGKPRAGPLDPVDDPQREWVGLPAGAEARRILADPPRNEPLVPRPATSPPCRIEVIEVMQVVEPEPVRTGIVPVCGVGKRPLGIQKPKNVFFDQAPFTQRRQWKDCCCYLSPPRRGRGVGPRPAKGKPGSPENLARSEMAKRVVVER